MRNSEDENERGEDQIVSKQIRITVGVGKMAETEERNEDKTNETDEEEKTWTKERWQMDFRRNDPS